MTIDPTELARLKALAEAATPGPWCIAGCSDEHTRSQNYACYRVRGADSEPVERRDVHYIAAANPQVVLALIAEVERLKAERERTRQALLAYTEQHGWEHDIYASGDDEVECPEDDTCECVYFPALNAAMRGPDD